MPDPRLWQLISPTLPVGGYSYSQGLEYAVHAGWVHDEATALAWIGGLAENAMTAVDLPLMARVHAAARAGDAAAVVALAARLATYRETAELRREDADMASALRRLLAALAPELDTLALASYPALFALACAHWGIAPREALAGYLWAWAENQVQGATRLVPLGQTAAQRALFALGDRLEDCVTNALAQDDDDLGYTAPGLVFASAAHETQYTRLFRS